MIIRFIHKDESRQTKFDYQPVEWSEPCFVPSPGDTVRLGLRRNQYGRQIYRVLRRHWEDPSCVHVEVEKA